MDMKSLGWKAFAKSAPLPHLIRAHKIEIATMIHIGSSWDDIASMLRAETGRVVDCQCLQKTFEDVVAETPIELKELDKGIGRYLNALGIVGLSQDGSIESASVFLKGPPDLSIARRSRCPWRSMQDIEFVANLMGPGLLEWCGALYEPIPAVVALSLKAGADPEAATGQAGETPPPLAFELRKREDGESPLAYAQREAKNNSPAANIWMECAALMEEAIMARRLHGKGLSRENLL